MNNIMLIGLGPHAKRIYIKYIKENNVNLSLIIDLKSSKNRIDDFLKKNHLVCDTYFVDDLCRDSRELSVEVKSDLKKYIEKNKITDVIISTEPKAHYAYLKFFISQNINILVDKPLTAIEGISVEKEKSKIIENDYQELIGELQESNSTLVMQCQRRWHEGYRYIYNLVQETCFKYNIPITSINISHADGMWNMPDEFLFRENHPYKYGYGKLMHSGVHFVDLLCWFMEINEKLKNKIPNNYELVSMTTRPSDFVFMINNKDYKQFFGNNNYYKIDYEKFKTFGGIDVDTMIRYKHNDKIVCTATLNLKQNSFSRRGWCTLPEDTYKSNGRVRHEYMNLNVGPLMNIQVHSYQSKEIKDEDEKDNFEIGGCQHFDIYIFRNTSLIGGKEFEKLSIKDIVKNQTAFLGHNEIARKKCIYEFLNKQSDNKNIYKQRKTISLLTSMYESIAGNCEKINKGI